MDPFGFSFLSTMIQISRLPLYFSSRSLHKPLSGKKFYTGLAGYAMCCGCK